MKIEQQRKNGCWLYYKLLSNLHGTEYTPGWMTVRRFAVTNGMRYELQSSSKKCATLFVGHGPTVELVRANVAQTFITTSGPIDAWTAKSKPNRRCDVCGRLFRRVYDLHRHSASVHERTSPYRCSICDKYFSRKDQLEQHTQGVHLKQRMATCKICNTKFSTKSAADRHQRIVHDRVKRYNCTDCESSFYQKSDLKRHLSLKHLPPTKIDSPLIEEGHKEELPSNKTSVRHEAK